MQYLYGWVSVVTPFIGMVMSMISHRYAYMNFSLAVFCALCFMVWVTRK